MHASTTSYLNLNHHTCHGETTTCTIKRYLIRAYYAYSIHTCVRTYINWGAHAYNSVIWSISRSRSDPNSNPEHNMSPNQKHFQSVWPGSNWKCYVQLPAYDSIYWEKYWHEPMRAEQLSGFAHRLELALCWWMRKERYVDSNLTCLDLHSSHFDMPAKDQTINSLESRNTS
jgi:hypothetical protein